MTNRQSIQSLPTKAERIDAIMRQDFWDTLFTSAILVGVLVGVPVTLVLVGLHFGWLTA